MGYKLTNRHPTKTFTIPTVYGGGTLPPGGSITILDTLANVNNAFGDANQGGSTDPLDFDFARGGSGAVLPGAAPAKAHLRARNGGVLIPVLTNGGGGQILIPFAFVTLDTENGMSGDGKTYTVAPGKGGDYLVIVTMAWNEAFAGPAYFHLMHTLATGAGPFSRLSVVRVNTVAGEPIQMTMVCQLAAGDTLDVRVAQNSGATRNVTTGLGDTPTSPHLIIRQL